jgi:uncharacterized RDD family membrane protein YckC
MNWYYVDQGQQAGPIDDSQLQALLQQGKIQADTLVWKEGMPDWQPYNVATGLAKPLLRMANEPDAPPAVEPHPEAAPRPAASLAPVVVTTGPEAVCTECGQLFPAGEMTRHGQAHVCAGCRPKLMQKLAENARASAGTVHYAGFWIRFVAMLLDGMILVSAAILVGLLAGMSVEQTLGLEQTAESRALWIQLIQLGMGLTYEVLMIGKYGATLGKMACRICVVTDTGAAVSYGRALGRWFAKILGACICLIGYIIAGFDDQKRALHDHICSTRVVYK